jgi:DNA repair exonuclease SbcCD ATPase subunit
MVIPSLVQGIIETEDGKVFELETSKGLAWLESIGSFRFEPSNGGKPYTVRKESGIYWYGCRKIAGKVRKKYIGKSLEVTVDKLEEIAEALEIPPTPRANRVAEVAEVAQEVAEEVTEVAQDRLTALEWQVANLQKAVEALQDALPGKLDSGNSLELPKVDSEVIERLHNELGNLKAENEKLKADYAVLLESSTVVTKKLRQEVQELRSQLEQERADREEVEAQLTERGEQIRQLLSELAELKQKSATAGKNLPEAADLLNQLKKAKGKKFTASLADVEAILEMLES